MKYSEFWLREWVNPALDSSELAEQITMAGLEVERVEPVAPRFQGVVVGEIVSCRPHPNADKLRITEVDCGEGTLLTIVCGAANCRQALKVAVAQVGALLPSGLVITEASLRGQRSSGMLCSWEELGISSDSSGIIELPAEAPVGDSIRDFLQLDDNVIEISVTPNRGDCLSVMGLAREVAALNYLSYVQPPIAAIASTIEATLPVKIEAPSAVPRYLVRKICGININAVTPLWMKERLRRCGMRSIDPVVDVTNYVLLEMGQPMHAFDCAKVAGSLIVRMATENEKLTLLNENEITLTPDVLVIADQQGVLALAGIFGGLSSGVSCKTQDILLEAAWFHPHAIAGRARRYGLHTEAAHRFERGVDPAISRSALERATALLLTICGGEAGPIVDYSDLTLLPQPATITLTQCRLKRLLGVTISHSEITAILQHLGCVVITAEKHWQVTPPTWRSDLAIEEDLVEEVARLYGYNSIPAQPLQVEQLAVNAKEENIALNRVKNLLVDRGFQEIISYSFVDPVVQKVIHAEEALTLLNPISKEMSVMRLSLLTGLLTTVSYNERRQQDRIRLFECGLRFVPYSDVEHGVLQELVIAGCITGNRNEAHWDAKDSIIDFYDLKGDLESVLELTGMLDSFEFRAQSIPALHPSQSATIYLHGEQIGIIGVIHPQLESKLYLSGRTVVFELLWNKIAKKLLPKAKPISRYPANRRDIAIVVANSIPVGDVLSACREVDQNRLIDVNLFDVYRGESVKAGYKSLAISLILQDLDHTLEEDEITATVNECIAVLKERFQANLRD